MNSVHFGNNTFEILGVKPPNVEKFQNSGLKNFEIERFSHRGIFKVLENKDILIDLIVGTGIGILAEAA